MEKSKQSVLYFIGYFYFRNSEYEYWYNISINILFTSVEYSVLVNKHKKYIKNEMLK